MPDNSMPDNPDTSMPDTAYHLPQTTQLFRVRVRVSADVLVLASDAEAAVTLLLGERAEVLAALPELSDNAEVCIDQPRPILDADGMDFYAAQVPGWARQSLFYPKENDIPDFGGSCTIEQLCQHLGLPTQRRFTYLAPRVRCARDSAPMRLPPERQAAFLSAIEEGIRLHSPRSFTIWHGTSAPLFSAHSREGGRDNAVKVATIERKDGEWMVRPTLAWEAETTETEAPCQP